MRTKSKYDQKNYRKTFRNHFWIRNAWQVRFVECEKIHGFQRNRMKIKGVTQSLLKEKKNPYVCTNATQCVHFYFFIFYYFVNGFHFFVLLYSFSCQFYGHFWFTLFVSISCSWCLFFRFVSLLSFWAFMFFVSTLPFLSVAYCFLVFLLFFLIR